eukprot:s673_g23.t1
MDDQTDLSLDDHVSLGTMPKDLWSECPLDKHPDEPEAWVDRLADQVELTRFCRMDVLKEVDKQSLTQEQHLTTKFVYDWRVKDFTNADGSVCRKSWNDVVPRTAMHVDDVMFCGDAFYGSNVSLQKLKVKYKIIFSQLEGVGSEISFLKRKLKRLETGLALIPGTGSSKVIENFEAHFGKARQQTIPCGGSIQIEDLSARAVFVISLAPEDPRITVTTSAISIGIDAEMGSVESLSVSGDGSGDSDAAQEHGIDTHCIAKHDMLQDAFLTPDILYNCWRGLDAGLEIRLPWETGIWGQIFANQPLKVFPALPEPKWKRPVCPEDIPLSTETDERPLKRFRPSTEPLRWRQFVACTDAVSWRESQEAKLDTALKRWFSIILQFPGVHATVKQLHDAATLPEQLRILRDIMSGKAPATLIKRANAMLRYLERLRKAKQSAPGTEETLYAYFCELRDASVPLSRLRATIEAIRFTEHMFGIDGLVKLLVSKRCLGASRVIGETVHRQADPFSVEQLAKLHETLHDVHSPFWDRLVSGTALVACYTRSRWMDMQHTDTISLDPDEHDPVYLELRIKEFETKKANAWRGGVMAAVGPATGVVCGNWLVQWWDLRKSLQAPLEDGYPLLPAPDSAGEATIRPLSTKEFSVWIRSSWGS